MFSAFGLSRSAGAAVAFARTGAVGIGGNSSRIISIGSVRVWLGDKMMFQAFCQACENPKNDGHQKRQTGDPHNRHLRTLTMKPWILSQFLLAIRYKQYPRMLRQAHRKGGYALQIH